MYCLWKRLNQKVPRKMLSTTVSEEMLSLNNQVLLIRLRKKWSTMDLVINQIRAIKRLKYLSISTKLQNNQDFPRLSLILLKIRKHHSVWPIMTIKIRFIAVPSQTKKIAIIIRKIKYFRSHYRSLYWKNSNLSLFQLSSCRLPPCIDVQTYK